jgi:hypothetical protein
MNPLALRSRLVIEAPAASTEIEAAEKGATRLAEAVEIAAAGMPCAGKVGAIAAEVVIAGEEEIAAVAVEIAAVTEADEEFHEKPTITSAGIDNRLILTRTGDNHCRYD